MSNALYYGDNLEILRDYIEDESVDLVYLDPPFNSQQQYNVLFKERDGSLPEAQIKAFEDFWRWDAGVKAEYERLVGPRAQRDGIPHQVTVFLEAMRRVLGSTDMMAYLVMMAPRLVELHRGLRQTGSLYLHCDPTASHYLKLLMDSVFGPGRLLNEIIWKRTTAHSKAQRYAPVHDVILFYAKSDEFTWNSPRTEYAQEYLDKYYKFDDGDGRLYWRADLTAAGVRSGSSGKPWRGIDPTAMGRHWAIDRSARSIVGDLDTLEALDALDAAGRIYWPPRGTKPQYKRYREDLKGKPVTDVWDDIDRINPVGSERLGYPTQKPVALLERIISASSNEGDTILDPFCGCGTSIDAAEKLGRRWVGIDITHLAISIIRRRLAAGAPNAQYETIGEPVDLESARALAETKPFDFQWWAIDCIGAHPAGPATQQGRRKKGRKGMDRGVDGLIRFVDEDRSRFVLVSVKSGKVSSKDVRELIGAMDTHRHELGVFLCLRTPTKEMRAAAAAAGKWHGYDRVQIITVKDIFKGKMPKYPGSESRPKSYPPPGQGAFDFVRETPAKGIKSTRPAPAAAPAKKRRRRQP